MASVAQFTESPVSARGRTIELTCADASLTDHIPDAGFSTSVGGLTFEATLDGEVRGLLPQDVGLEAPEGLFWLKTPVYLKPGATATVELPADSPGYLAWVPARIWTTGSGQPLDLARWMASRVTFEGCSGESTDLGGFLSTDQDMCLTLRIRRSPGERARAVRLGAPERC